MTSFILKLLIIILAALMGCGRPQARAGASAVDASAAPDAVDASRQEAVKLGAERTEVYLPMLKGKKVGLFSNHTGVLPSGEHTLDVLKKAGVDVRCAFSPEHGFRGTADAGEAVACGVDPQTGVKIVSLYGNHKAKAMEEAMNDIDVVVVDIQDVGLRYYTYYITMLELMDSAAKSGKSVMVLDRPNPNGMTVDGPVLDMKYASGVGKLPIPVVHGMTLGELARMINGEGWLKEGRTVDLTVVPCEGYTHRTRYRLPVAPSPNLRTMTAVYLYPSLCYFEGTAVSLGRGTDRPFEIYGHPDMKARSFSFTPERRPGAKNPPQLGKKCYGADLSAIPHEEAIAQGVNLEYVIDAYNDLKSGGKPFFKPFFNLLIGRGDIAGMIERGMTADQIKATWSPDVERFIRQRRPYLLYDE